jgi:putative transposase
MLTFCEQLMPHACTGLATELREFNGETDEVHLLVHYPLPTQSRPVGAGQPAQRRIVALTPPATSHHVRKRL